MIREKSISRAINHLHEVGDTDILPPLFEFTFFKECQEEIIGGLLGFDYNTKYVPRSCFEVLSPKTKLSFRIAHQLFSTDSLLYTAAAIDVGKHIEGMRLPWEQGPFSYRFVDDDDQVHLFAETSNYHDWLGNVRELCAPDNPFERSKSVIETDISDFYARIYFHRIEHVLDDCDAEQGVRKVIEKVIKSSRARQSHGLPVGTAASRLLAEGILNDTDRMLSARGLVFTRYVDDFRIMLDHPDEAHSVLCKLAEHLMLTEGLSLNAAKTKILTNRELIAAVDGKLTDVFSTEEMQSLTTYFQRVYDGEDVPAGEIDGIDSDLLEERLSEILKREYFDPASIKVILKALRATGTTDPVMTVTNFIDLLYHTPRDFCIAVGALAQRSPETASNIADILLGLASKSPYAEMALSRIWLLHLFVTGALPITTARFALLPHGDTVIEKRQRLLLRGKLNDRNFFREHKTRFAEMSDWEKSALMIGASCLSRSEYSTWLGFIRQQTTDIFSVQYCNWLSRHHGELFEKLNYNFVVKSYAERNVDDFDIVVYDV